MKTYSDNNVHDNIVADDPKGLITTLEKRDLDLPEQNCKLPLETATMSVCILIRLVK